MPKEIKNTEVTTMTGKEIKIPDPNAKEGEQPQPVTAKVKDIIQLFIFAIPADKIKYKDTAMVTNIYNQINVGVDKNAITINNDEYDWLKTKWEEFSTLMFGANASFIWDKFMQPVQ